MCKACIYCHGMYPWSYLTPIMIITSVNTSPPICLSWQLSCGISKYRKHQTWKTFGINVKHEYNITKFIRKPVRSHCCQQVVGCEDCVQQWMDSNNTCPLCLTDTTFMMQTHLWGGLMMLSNSCLHWLSAARLWEQWQGFCWGIFLWSWTWPVHYMQQH